MTGLGVAGVISTSYLTGKASYQASILLENDLLDSPTRSENLKERVKEQVKQTWRLYVPAGISGVLTIGCIIGANRGNVRRTTAAVTAYSITERAFSEYKEKVVEQIGKGKEQKIRDELAQERVTKNQSNEVMIIGSGHILCCELFTHRYFRSDMETLRKSVNDINMKIVNNVYVTLDEFYDLIGLAQTTESNKIGWDSNKLLELQFSTVLSSNGEPCLAFDYNYTKPLQ